GAIRTGQVDCRRHDLRRGIRRGAEVLAVPAVSPLEAGDDLRLRVQREVRVVHVRADAGERRVVEAVRSHQLDVALARCLHLVPERLTLRGQLPRDVDELRVAGDL